MGAKAASTADNQSRAQQFQDIQRKMNEGSPIFPLLNPGQSVVSTKNLTNVAYSPVWYIDFAAIGTT
jgi:peptide/nickel transport system substrate-binding protein